MSTSPRIKPLTILRLWFVQDEHFLISIMHESYVFAF